MESLAWLQEDQPPEARPCHYEWVLSTREQCLKYGVAFHFKQTEANFVMNGRTYHIQRKHQMSQAAKASIDDVEVTKNLNTDWTAQRLIGYLSHYQKLKMEDVADEVLAILSDRNRIMQKKSMEEVNARWNQFLYEGFDEEEEEF